MERRRVVITGLGLVAPVGCGADYAWKNIISGKSGINRITRFPVDELPDSVAKIAGEITDGEGEGEFNIGKYVERKDQKKMDRFIPLAIAAATEAVEDSGWVAETEEQQLRTGVMIGSGVGGLPAIQKNSIICHERGMKKISPFFIPACLINLASGHVSIKYGFRGPNHACVTACASGTHAIGDAARIIADGDADVMVAGGAESAICEIGIGGFSAMNALSTRNDDPTRASRPWDKDRDGFVMGEGSGIFVLEDYEHAKARGAKIYAEVVGYGLTGDAYHMSAPDSQSRGSINVMKMALRKAGLNPEDVDYINAHGTSTPVGDGLEFNAVKTVFGNCLDKVSMSSTKSMTGHLLGAAGAIEAVFSVLAMRDGIVPPTINLDNVDENCTGIDLTPHKAKEKEINVAISNSFGFGGTNACVAFKKIK